MRSAGFVVVVVALVGACDFQTNPAMPDGPKGSPDVPIDMPGMFTIDAESHIATPQSKAEWQAFIAVKGLTITPPDGLWLMDEAGGQITDHLGTAALTPIGTPMYQQSIAGWQRRGVVTQDNQNNAFQDNPDANLPVVAQDSVMVLMYYASTDVPGNPGRTVLVVGSGNQNNVGELTIDPMGHFTLTVNAGSVTTSNVYAPNLVVPIVVKLDRAHNSQTLYTRMEMPSVSPTQTLVASQGAIILGTGSLHPPPAIWLYMAAWYRHDAEMTDMQVNGLINALGF